MKRRYILVICALLLAGGSLIAKDLNIKGTTLETVINDLYDYYKKKGRAADLPQAFKDVHAKIAKGIHTFSEDELTKAVPNWRSLNGMSSIS